MFAGVQLVLAALGSNRTAAFDSYLLNLTIPTHTVSGFSAGADMAVDHFVAYSASCKGMGINAGAPYGCVVLPNALTTCGKWSARVWDGSVPKFWAYTEAKGSKIDALSNMKSSPIYLYQGTADEGVDLQIMKYTESYFKKYVDPSLVQTNFNIASNHAWIVDNAAIGNACNHFGKPYINHCNFDLAGAMLKHLKVSDPTILRGEVLAGNLVKFSQAKYAPLGHSVAGISMAQDGYVYVPAKCKASAQKSCKIHVMYHGCGQSAGYVGTELALYSGFNAHAESSGIVVLYPQAINNPTYQNAACWDWWGHYGAGPQFDEHSGYQLEAVINMLKDIDRIASGKDPALDDDEW